MALFACQKQSWTTIPSQTFLDCYDPCDIFITIEENLGLNDGASLRGLTNCSKIEVDDPRELRAGCYVRAIITVEKGNKRESPLHLKFYENNRQTHAQV